MKIKGKLYRKGNNKVGIEWKKYQGNDFWLSAIINEINLRLKVLMWFDWFEWLLYMFPWFLDFLFLFKQF